MNGIEWQSSMAMFVDLRVVVERPVTRTITEWIDKELCSRVEDAVGQGVVCPVQHTWGKKPLKWWLNVIDYGDYGYLMLIAG